MNAGFSDPANPFRVQNCPFRSFLANLPAAVACQNRAVIPKKGGFIHRLVVGKASTGSRRRYGTFAKNRRCAGAGMPGQHLDFVTSNGEPKIPGLLRYLPSF
ncbi:hypothetical protein [Paraflavitalea pollutisoli]|uniref:hypothetical protein n=1 Tax=Paraflavitalea pollutisoli TaxID=3034143 RepID=UPI0023EABE92|nr:hypothetical protein [Paraflavitalea sp. H1-2-19X]